MAMEQATISAYRLPDGARIEEALQRDGRALWAVRKPGSCLYRNGSWDYEPPPSSRNDKFMAQARWPTAESAYQAWEQAGSGES